MLNVLFLESGIIIAGMCVCVCARKQAKEGVSLKFKTRAAEIFAKCFIDVCGYKKMFLVVIRGVRVGHVEVFLSKRLT